MKSGIDELPRLMLHFAGLVPLDAEAAVQTLRPETSPPVRAPDFVAVVTKPDFTPFVFHVEFETDWKSDVPQDMALYGGSLAAQHRKPVESVLVLLREEGAPAEVPTAGAFKIDRTTITHEYRVAKMWELKPEPILESKNPKVLPWVVLMKSSEEQLRQAGRLLAALEDEEPLAHFMMLGAIRYDREQLEQYAGGRKMRLAEALVQGSWVAQEIRNEGREEGHAEGRIAEARRLLRSLLAKRFPGLETMPEIDRIEGVDRLETLLIHEVLSGDRDRVEAAIRAAAAS